MLDRLKSKLMMSLILSHPTSNGFVRAALKGLDEAGILYEFHTSIASFPDSMLDKLARFRSFSEIRRRTFDISLRPYTKIYPWWEIGRLLATKSKFNNLIRHENGLFCVDKVYKTLDKHVSLSLHKANRKGVNAIYAYEDGAYLSFQKAKKLGIRCLYDLPIGYWRTARRLLSEEAQMRPEWAATIIGLNDSESKLERKDEELHLADRIYVASSFTAKTLQDYPANLAPIEIIPYGFPPVISNEKTYKTPKKLKLLFVGGLSQRKGIANLFEVVDQLGNHVELTIIGRKSVDNCHALNKALSKHRWIPSLAHNQILEQMKIHDVLVFPSLFEGFGLVISEAMSQGTPVITTDRTAGPDIIEHGKDGWLIKAGSTESLLAAVDHLLTHPTTIFEAGNAAMKKAQQRSWQDYSRKLCISINNYLSEN